LWAAANRSKRIGDSAAGHSQRYVKITGSENGPNAGAEIVRGHPEQASAQFLKLLDIAERQKHVIEQWRRAQALGPTDDQLWGS
jgi:hypothetical protein